MSKPNIGLIGFGFVGKAVVHGFTLHANIKIYDKYQQGLDTLEDTVHNSDYIFVCVPTPMKETGSQDLSCVFDVMDSIKRITDKPKTIILKSTIIPGTTRKLANTYKDYTFVFNPEFLTERTAKLDFINSARIVLGGNDVNGLTKVEEMYRTRFTHTPIYKTSWEGAELVKYMANCFFAVKISFLNEFYDIATFLNIPYEELRDMWLADFRIGNSHTDVPGHDGSKGFGGKCFVKDINALTKWADKKGLKTDTLKAAVKVNNRVRQDKDWENIKGATTKNNYE